MKFTVRNVFDTTVDKYWDFVFFDPEYNRRLYLEALGFKAFEMIEVTGEPGQTRTRAFRTEPNADAPAIVRKLIGDSLVYTERGTWDPKTKVWTYAIKTNKLVDKISITGQLWAEPREGGAKCERIAEVEIKVDILGVGGAIEKFVEKTTRESYVKTSAFTNRFIAEKGY